MKCLTDILKSALLRNHIDGEDSVFYQRFIEKASKHEDTRGRPKFIDADSQSNYSQQSPLKARHEASGEKHHEFYF